MSKKFFLVRALFRISKKVILYSGRNYSNRYKSMKLVLSLLTLLLIGRGSGGEVQSARYVLIKSSSSSQIQLQACASNGSIETCGTWCYPRLYSNCSRHFFISSVNKETGVKGKIHFLCTCIKYPWIAHAIHVLVLQLLLNQINKMNPFFKLGTATSATATLSGIQIRQGESCLHQ